MRLGEGPEKPVDLIASHHNRKPARFPGSLEVSKIPEWFFDDARETRNLSASSLVARCGNLSERLSMNLSAQIRYHFNRLSGRPCRRNARRKESVQNFVFFSLFSLWLYILMETPPFVANGDMQESNQKAIDGERSCNHRLSLNIIKRGPDPFPARAV